MPRALLESATELGQLPPQLARRHVLMVSKFDYYVKGKAGTLEALFRLASESTYADRSVIRFKGRRYKQTCLGNVLLIEPLAPDLISSYLHHGHQRTA